MLFSDAVFNIFAGVFDVSIQSINQFNQSMMFKTSLLFCYFCIRFFQTSMLLFVSVCCYAKPRCYYSCPYGVIRNLDAIIRVCMLLCETSMLLFVFRIMFVLIRVFRELDHYGPARVIN